MYSRFMDSSSYTWMNIFPLQIRLTFILSPFICKVCSTAATQSWIYNIGINPKPQKLWNAWHVHNQTAGYITEFDLGDTDSSFLFVTVHGAGHEVPAYRPVEAFSLFQSFFNGEWN